MSEDRENPVSKRSGERLSLVPAGSFSSTSEIQRLDVSVERGGQEQQEQDLAVIVRQYLHMILKRKWLILSLTLAFAALGGIRAFLKTPVYVATARIQIDREAMKVVEGGAAVANEAGAGGADFLRTEYELLKSRTMAERVVSKLRLYEDADFFKPRELTLLGAIKSVLADPEKNITSPPSALQGWAVGIVSSNVTISPVPGSRLVDINFADTDTSRAEQIANAYAESYVASTLDKRFQANSYAKTFLEDQIKQLKIRLEDSEKAMLDFAENQKVVQVGEKTSVAENNYAAATSALGQLIAERIKNEQLWRNVENANAINVPELLLNGVIVGLREHRKALETEYQEKLESFKPGYPVMVQISNKMKEIDRQLAAEVNTIRSSLKAAYESSLAQENEMKARAEIARQEVLDLQKLNIQYNILKREVESNRGLYDNLLQRYKQVDLAAGVSTNNVFIVDKAIGASSAAGSLLRSLMLSLALGFGAGIALAYLLDRLDDRIRAPEELEQLSGLATLGIIPQIQSAQAFGDSIKDSRSPLSEAYRSFAIALQLTTESGLPRSFAVTSTGLGEGKSTTAVAIGRYYAQLGLKVLLVDSDLRRPTLHTKLQLDGSIGLSNFLTGSSLPPEVIQKTDHPNLALMASGPLPPNAADLLSGSRLYSLISLGAEVFDLIIFDSPPVLGMADAQLIAGAAGATLVVVEAGDQRKEMIRSALRLLRLARAKLIGTVLTKFDPKAVGYGYAHSYKYGYEYGSMAETDAPVARVSGGEHKPAAAIEGQRVSQPEAS
jgi:succinoglycan biosynthesis transport protein ExoP